MHKDRSWSIVAGYGSEADSGAGSGARSAAESKAGTEADHIIIDPARLDDDTPVSPKKKLSYFLALFVGIGIPVCIISLRDFFNETIRSKLDVSKITSIPILGVIDIGLPYYIERGINSANEESAQLIIFEIDT